MKRKVLLIPAAIFAASFVAGVAFAHNASALGTCQQGVAWSATNYNQNVSNTITVTIDGAVVYADSDFKASDVGSFTTDKTAAHTWSVVVNAPGTEFDKNLGGNYQACVVVPTTTTVAPTTTTTTVPVTTTTVTSTTVTATTDPTTTTTPTTTTIAPTVRGEPICEPDMPCWPCRAYPNFVCPLPVAEPALPRTGSNNGVLFWAAVAFVLAGTYLVVRGRRVP